MRGVCRLWLLIRSVCGSIRLDTPARPVAKYRKPLHTHTHSLTTESDNPYLEAPAGALLSRAKELLAMNGSLDEAALLCEAAIQKHEMGEGGFEA